MMAETVHRTVKIRGRLILFCGINQNVKGERVRVLHLERVEPPLPSCLADVDVEPSYKPKNRTAET